MCGISPPCCFFYFIKVCLLDIIVFAYLFLCVCFYNPTHKIMVHIIRCLAYIVFMQEEAQGVHWSTLLIWSLIFVVILDKCHKWTVFQVVLNLGPVLECGWYIQWYFIRENWFSFVQQTLNCRFFVRDGTFCPLLLHSAANLSGLNSSRYCACCYSVQNPCVHQHCYSGKTLLAWSHPSSLAVIILLSHFQHRPLSWGEGFDKNIPFKLTFIPFWFLNLFLLVCFNFNFSFFVKGTEKDREREKERHWEKKETMELGIRLARKTIWNI